MTRYIIKNIGPHRYETLDERLAIRRLNDFRNDGHLQAKLVTVGAQR